MRQLRNLLRPRGVSLLLAASVPLLGLLGALTVGGEPASAVTANDIDLAACQSFHNRDARPAAEEEVQGVLGLSRRASHWSAGRIGAEDSATFLYRLAFRKEIALGSLLLDATADEVRLLKADAPYPGDPGKAEHWMTVTLPRRTGGRVVALPAGLRTRAILIADRQEKGARGVSEVRYLRLLTERLHNVAPLAHPYADREYTPPNTTFVPEPATHIPEGRGRWVNVGKDDKGFIPAPPITEINPSWFLLTWREEQALTGLWVRSNIEKLELYTYDGPADVNPRAGTPEEWRKVRTFDEQFVTLGKDDTARWVRFPQPITTRGLRLLMLKTSEGPIASITGLHALVNLGDRPVPETRVAGDEPPPFALKYQQPDDGNITLAINTPDGRRVRNMLVRAVQTKGEHVLPWDLKDEKGTIIAPGTYRWTALTWPELQYRYEMTAYPNIAANAPENSPWLNGHNGSGGWLADHSAPVGGCVAGDRVYLSAYVAESGVSLIECDLQGRKQWGHHSFAAWTGPRYLAADSKEVFVGAPILGTSTEAVWAVDHATKKVRNVLSLTPTATRLRGLQGMAVRDGKVYLSIRGNESWLTGAASADDADIMACVPLLPETRKPRVAYEVVPDPRGDFLRLFRLTGTPPGGATQFTNPFLETPGGKLPMQHIVLAFKRPVPLGSVVFPRPEEKGIRVILSALKPNAPYPPDPEKAEQWTPFSDTGKAPWDVVAAPEKTLTRALRITFAKGKAASDDPLDKMLDGKDDSLDFGTDKTAWKGKLEGMKLLRRRFVNVAGEAAIRVNSGKVAADGTWDAARDRPLSETDPGIYALEWKTEQTLRGLALKEIDGDVTRVDVWTGAADKAIDIAAAEGWQQVAEYRQERRDHHTGFPSANPTARYVDGYADFGKEVKTRAVRLRVVRQWVDNAPDSRGVRADLGGTKLDARRCRVWGVAALKYVGGESPVDPAQAERIEIWDTASGKAAGEVSIRQPGEIAFNPEGSLFTISGAQVLKVDLAGTAHKPFITDLQAPTALTFDPKGNLYVFDGGKERKRVRVYDPSGKYLRSLGTPGGFKAGPWDPTCMGEVSALAVDHTGQLWVVEAQWWPKRITVWTTGGIFKKELLGNTGYGGGGVIDPEDKTRMFYGPLEFELDWKTGLSRLKNFTWTEAPGYNGWAGGIPAGEVPLRVNGRTYVVTRPQDANATMPAGIVFLYDNEKLKMAAAMGAAASFEPLKQPDIQARLGNRPLTGLRFLWTDRNGDGRVQADEVVFSEKGPVALTNFNRDLGIQAGTVRYRVKEFLPDGVPVYEEQQLPALKGSYLYRLDDGNFFRIGEKDLRQASLAADGSERWTYPQDGQPGVQNWTTVKPWRPDQVVAQFGIVGHGKTHAGGLGEFIVIHGNTGCWNLWSGDGLLVGPLFRDFRSGKSRPWSMKEHERGLSLDGVTVGEEHFAGYFCRTADDHYYAVAGHNHASIVEVLGIDRIVRLGGEITVTPEDVRKAREYNAQRQTQEAYTRSPVLDVYRLRKPPTIDGKLDDWGPSDAHIPEGADLRLGYDDTHLYLAYSVRNLGPLLNKGREWDRLFKSGAAVDLHIGTNATAPNQRQAPQAGDVRLLLTFMDKEPAAVLYRPVVPGTPPEKAWRVTSPTGEAVFDEVVQLKGVRMARSSDANGYILEAAVPLAALGLKPAPGLRLKIDWGVLVSGPDGTEVFRRVYWANKATQIVSDAPSEARLYPNLWGYALFHGLRPTNDALGEIAGPGDKTPGKDVKKDVDDLLDDLKTKKKP